MKQYLALPKEVLAVIAGLALLLIIALFGWGSASSDAGDARESAKTLETDLRQQIGALETRAGDAEKRLEDTTAASGALEDLQAQIATAQTDLETRTSEIAARDEQIAALDQEIATRQSSVEELEGRVETVLGSLNEQLTAVGERKYQRDEMQDAIGDRKSVV